MCMQVVCLTLYKPSKFELWWADNGRSRTLPAAFLFTDSSRTLQVKGTTSGWIQGSGFRVWGWGLECGVEADSPHQRLQSLHLP